MEMCSGFGRKKRVLFFFFFVQDGSESQIDTPVNYQWSYSNSSSLLILFKPNDNLSTSEPKSYIDLFCSSVLYEENVTRYQSNYFS